MGSSLRVAALVLVATVALAAPKKGAAPAPAKKPPPPPAAAPSKPAPPPPSSNGGGGGGAEPAPSTGGGGGVRGGATGSPASRKTAEGSQDSAPLGSRTGGPTRVDFDDRLVQGQSTKQGAIYLFERKENPLRSMLRRRENFRSEIAGSIQ